MKLKKHKLLKKGVAIFLSVTTMITLVPFLPGSIDKVQAGRPSVPTFVTKEDLLRNYKLDGSGTIGKIKFGAGDREWLIAGADGTDTLALLSTTSFGRSNYGTDSRYSESMIVKTVLPGYLGDTTYFSAGETSYMKDTTVSTLEYDQADGDTPRTVTGKLYLPNAADRYSYHGDTIYVGSNNNITIPLDTLGDSTFFGADNFLLRTSYNKNTTEILNTMITGMFNSIGYVYVLNEHHIVPALNLDLSTVLFGSAINAATTEGALTEDVAFTLRYESNSLGSATINLADDGIRVSGASTGTYLVVQKGVYAWAKSVSGTTTVNASDVSINGAPISSLTGCNVWIEKTNADRITTATLATQGAWVDTTPTSPSTGQTGDTGTSQSSGQESSGKAGVKKIIVNVKPEGNEGVVSSITVERTTDEKGVVTDSLTFTPDNAKEIVDRLKTEGKSLARIVLEDANNEVEKTVIQIPTSSISTMAGGDIDLQIDTPKAKIDIPKETIKNTDEMLGNDLFFKLVPVNNDTQKEEVQQRAVFTLASLGNANDAISVLGVPVEIETNMPSSEVSITLPLTGVTIPADEAEREKFLKQLGVYIEHSDGEKVLEKGELVDYGNGVFGIRFKINKFSTFTVVQTDAFQNSSSIQQVIVPENAVINGTTISAFIEKGTQKVAVNVVTGENTTWKLYSNKKCTKALKNNTMSVNNGSGAAYIKVTGADGKSTIYKIVLAEKSVEHANFVKLGLIGSKSYAEKVAGMFANEYECKNVTITQEGKYYRVALDYKDEAIAAFACADMKKREYINNYYYVN